MNRTAMILGAAAAVAVAPRQQGKTDDMERRMHLIDDPQASVHEIVGDELPDRISIERPSAFYDEVVTDLGVRIDGIEQDSVVEYCVSEGWARIGERDLHGKLIWEFDHYRARRVDGVKVEPYWRRALSRQQRRARAARARKAK